MDQQGLRIVETPPRSLEDYVQFGPETVEAVRQAAMGLQGLTVYHVNSTAVGGGVAEMLGPEVALERSVGLNSNWLVIPPDRDFFRITKKIHNLLQGGQVDLTERDRAVYLGHNAHIGRLLSEIKPRADILIIHDPQPAVSLHFMTGDRPKSVFWRCHIDTTNPDKTIWDFITPFLTDYDRLIFSDAEYVHNAFPEDKVRIITPVIDPLSPKNTRMDISDAKAYIARFGIDTEKPLITQISRLDPWKDPLGVIEAYRLAKKDIPDLQLVLTAQSATDDPEGEEYYAKVTESIGGERGIFLIVDPEYSDTAANALQTASDIILQKSLKEGFGLTVTEAMWKGAVVIAGNTVGIRKQITDGVNGLLVNSVGETAEKIVHVLSHPGLRERISKEAHVSVYKKFLLPVALRNHLILYASVM